MGNYRLDDCINLSASNLEYHCFCCNSSMERTFYCHNGRGWGCCHRGSGNGLLFAVNLEHGRLFPTSVWNKISSIASAVWGVISSAVMAQINLVVSGLQAAWNAASTWLQ